MRLAVVILLIFAFAFLDAFCDGIKDLKTHFGDAGDSYGRVGHPFRDAWHLAKLGTRILLAAAAVMLDRLLSKRNAANRPPFYVVAFAVVFTLFGGYLVWTATYQYPEIWLKVDDTLHISTGIGWLDKFLGLHW